MIKRLFSIRMKIKHTAELKNLRTLKDALNEYLQTQQIHKSRTADIELTAEELIVNTMNYAYPNSKGDVELSCKKQKDKLIIKIIDKGIPFNPTSFAKPKLDVPLEERDQGGMGIYLAKNLADNMTYKRDGDKNVLTVYWNI